MKPSRGLVMVAALTAAAMLATAQQQGGGASSAPASASSKPKQSSPQGKQKDGSDSLFRKKLNYGSSKTTKESTTLAFNGVDPSGKVDKQMMLTTPGAADRDKVQEMSANRPTTDQLRAFLKEGGLKRK